MKYRYRSLLILVQLLLGVCGCSSSRVIHVPTEVTGAFTPGTALPLMETPAPARSATAPVAGDAGEDVHLSLSSLQKVNDYPLYTMTYYGDYSQSATVSLLRQSAQTSPLTPAWGCSLFAAMGDPGQKIYGRNFDWNYSPALLLFTHPEDGYSSVAMVDLAYIVAEEDYNHLVDLPLEERTALLLAPWLPFDGMNAAGVVIGMAAVPESEMALDPSKETLDSLQVMREVLDYAGNVDEAVAILGKYNIDWGNAPALHYLVADRSGRAVLVEFVRNEMVQIYNQDPWLAATNFLVSQAGDQAEWKCPRYRHIDQQLNRVGGRLTPREGLHLLSEVAQNGESGTQWSVVYAIDTGEVQVVMGAQFDRVFTFTLTE